MRADFSMLREDEKENIVLGLSGGPDSVYLLLQLHAYVRQNGNRLLAVHVNHGLRSSADEEEDFARDLCKRYGVPFRSVRVDVKGYAGVRKISIEEAGRELRYKAFEEALCEVFDGKGVIATAHHRADQAETVLFRLFRGTGLKGLGGMRSREGNRIRPILGVDKKDILTYLSENKIPYVLDESNEEMTYARNRIRGAILPLVNESVCENATGHIADTAAMLSDASDFVEDYLEKAEERILFLQEESLLLKKEAYDREHPYIQSEILKRALIAVAGRARDISRVHVLSLQKLLTQSQVGRMLFLPYGVRALRVHEGLRFVKGMEDGSASIESLAVEIPENPFEKWEVSFGKWHFAFMLKEVTDGSQIPRNRYTKCFDYAKIERSFGLFIRPVSKEDRVVIDEQGHHKMLMEDLKNQKVDRMDRMSIPVVATGEDVLWCPPFRYNEAYRIHSFPARVLEISVSKEE